MAQTTIFLDEELKRDVCKRALDLTGKQNQLSRIIREALKEWLAQHQDDKS